jgi:4-diphosphocytidyl-2-C-methyl-D-erythritol kinase
MQGLGERVTKLTPFPEFWLLLVNPGVPVSTAEVFRRLETRRGTGLQFPTGFGDLPTLCEFLKNTANDLEAPAKGMAPVIGDVLEELNAADGVLLARMSGSGATCFAMFSDPEKAKPLYEGLSARHPDWWIILTSLMRPGLSKPSR